jgi:hypothetical protein
LQFWEIAESSGLKKIALLCGQADCEGGNQQQP